MEPRPVCGLFSFDFHLAHSLRIVLLYFVGYQTINDLKIDFFSLRPRHTHENTLQIQEYSAMQWHLMGKKSTGESSSVSERGSLKQQLREYIRWEEAARNLLGLIEAEENRNHQPPQPKALGNQQPSWDSEDSSNFKDLVDSLLQVLNMKEGTPQLNQQ
uniref:Gastrin-releasing peptide n=2 Tax=Pongo abelii TaxID=9601 RepID=H2NWF7_PONAB